MTEDEALLAESLKLLGMLSHRTAFADTALFTVFDVLVGGDRLVNRAVYYTPEAIQTRLSMVRRVAGAKNLDKEMLSLIEALGDALKSVAAHRNDFAHSLYVLKADPQWEMRLHRVNPRHHPPGGAEITQVSLDHVELQSQEAFAKVQAAFRDVCLKLGIPPEVHGGLKTEVQHQRVER